MTEPIRFHPTLSSVKAHDAPAGHIARVLKHNVSGHRYYDAPPTAPRGQNTSVTRYSPDTGELRPPAKTTRPKPPNWTQERIDALPRTSGALTRVTALFGQRHGTIIVATCCCGVAKCAVTVRVIASVWQRDDQRPRSCRAGAQLKRRKQMSVPISAKGYALAREHSAKQRASK